MEMIGKLLQKLPLQSGIGRTGNSWQKQEFVIETIEQYPKKVCANLWGDKLDMLDTVNIGDTVKVSFSIESREFNGKWYTDVKAWKIEPATENPMQAAAPAYQATPATPAATAAAGMMPPMASDDLDTFTDNGGDDLPF
ncbi:MAG: DUF3127 domain-containing protein [Bacteroidales bacterium]|nr:DUF3127 domain-containing protein [Bacteroidales bacterium]